MKKFLAVTNLLLLVLATVATVGTAVAASGNLITNESVESAVTSGKKPTNWQSDKWGSNTTTFGYAATGHTGSKSLSVNMTKHKSGDAKWYFNNVAVTPNTKYTYSEFYKSNVATEIDIEYTNTAGKLSYAYLTAPAASPTAWQQVNTTFTTPANVKSLTVFHVIDKVGSLQTDDFSLTSGITPPSTPTDPSTPTNPTPTAPVVTLTAPVSNATISGVQTLSANATDAVAISGVQFAVDGIKVGAEDTAAPYTVNLDTTTLTNAVHSITATARNSAGLTTVTTTNVTVYNAPKPTAPVVQITSPLPNATLSGTTTIAANASDAVALKSVQFSLDGSSLGDPINAAPFSYNWDSTKVSNGLHTLTATALNTNNLSTTSTSVSITINNATAPTNPPVNTNGPNLVPNPSFESALNSTTPSDWQQSAWGTNTTTFSYQNSGHTGSKSAKVEITKYTDGAANWYYSGVPVTEGMTYQYTNWYQSNVDTEVDAEVVMNDGSTQYYYLGTVLASSGWAKFTTTFTAPAGAKTLAIYQTLAKVGTITVDDVSLSTYTPAPFKRALVSVTFDDGWANQYTNGRSVMQQNGLIGTYYIISSEVNDTPAYMSSTQIKQLITDGNELGSHSVSHPDMTTLTQAQLTAEMSNSKTNLQNLFGVSVVDFAYPYGAYNSATIATGKQYYQSQRSVNAGYNTKDNLDITQLKIYEVDSNISSAQVQKWIDGAIASKSWLVLCYHEIANTPAEPDDALYTIKPADFATQMAYLKKTGVATVTMRQALNEIIPQL